MPTLTITYGSPEERQAYERAIAFVDEMRQLGLQAPHGGVIDACEEFSLSKGQEFLRNVLTGAVQTRITESEKKVSQPADIGPEAKDDDLARS